ncbi:MAG: hypothetical protein FIA94_02405 [Nitrospirae bacterium]|nr:hypothetical protein [Nitrospirota bacterium]
MILPEIREISMVVDAVRDYAVASARACCEERLTESYQAPSLASWDACMWFDLLQNWELSCFLVSGTDRAKRLLRSLQSCLQWYGQSEIAEHLKRLSVLSILN